MSSNFSPNDNKTFFRLRSNFAADQQFKKINHDLRYKTFFELKLIFELLSITKDQNFVEFDTKMR